jgi:hypothetical protein
MLSVIYGLVTPPWEGYDKWWHFEYICFLHQNLRLPTTAEQQARPNSEIKQLPLYYVVGAALTGWIDLRDCSVPARNWNFGTAGAGINFVLHDPARESFPYQDPKLIALHITRLFSTLVGAFGIIFVNHLARTILPDRPRLVWLATALTAFQPQYIYLASILNNDILAIVAVTGLLAASVRLIVEGLNTKTMVWWGLALILAMSSKLNAVSAIPAAGLAVVFGGLDWLEQRGIARRTIWFGVGGVVVVVGIGLLVYFQISLGPAGQPEPWLPSVGYLLGRLAHPSSLRWDRIAPAIRHGFYTYWGAVGFGSIPLPQWLYWVIGVLCGLAAIGMVPVWQSANRSLRRVLAAFALLGFVTIATATHYYAGQRLHLHRCGALFASLHWRGVYRLSARLEGALA